MKTKKRQWIDLLNQLVNAPSKCTLDIKLPRKMMMVNNHDRDLMVLNR